MGTDGCSFRGWRGGLLRFCWRGITSLASRVSPEAAAIQLAVFCAAQRSSAMTSVASQACQWTDPKLDKATPHILSCGHHNCKGTGQAWAHICSKAAGALRCNPPNMNTLRFMHRQFTLMAQLSKVRRVDQHSMGRNPFDSFAPVICIYKHIYPVDLTPTEVSTRKALHQIKLKHLSDLFPFHLLSSCPSSSVSSSTPRSNLHPTSPELIAISIDDFTKDIPHSARKQAVIICMLRLSSLPCAWICELILRHPSLDFTFSLGSLVIVRQQAHGQTYTRLSTPQSSQFRQSSLPFLRLVILIPYIPRHPPHPLI